MVNVMIIPIKLCDGDKTFVTLATKEETSSGVAMRVF